MTRRVLTAAALAAALCAAAGAAAQQKFKLGSLPPGTTPFIVNTAWMQAVNKHVPGAEIRISATGPALRHQLMASEGKMDFFMYGVLGYHLMYKQIGPFKKITDGPARSRKLASIFSYPIGIYHFVVYESSGIRTLADIKGKQVFLGPPGGAATRNTRLLVEAMTGYEPGKDFKQVKMGWGPAQNAFLDRKFDVWIPVTNAPSPAVQQLALKNKIRLLSLDRDKFGHPAAKRYFSQPGRLVLEVPPDAYGDNQANEKPVVATGAWVGMGVRASMPEELVYEMTKAFFDNVEEAWQAASWMKDAVNLKNAGAALSGRLHPGAARYYREKGVAVGEVLNYDK